MQQKLPLQSDSIQYSQINILDDSLLPVFNGYCYIGNQLFYEVCKSEYKDELLGSFSSSPLNTGWKVHFSCAQNALPGLWRIVVPVLLANDCPAFKCVRLCNVPDQQKTSLYGRRCVDVFQFTAYIPRGEEDRYVVILQEIETLLSENNVVRPLKHQAHLFQSDKRTGVYISVRNSCGLDGKYLSAEQALKLSASNSGIPAYNIVGAYDPFETMDVLKEMQLAELEQAEKRALRPTMWQLAMQVMQAKQQEEAKQKNEKDQNGEIQHVTKSL